MGGKYIKVTSMRSQLRGKSFWGDIVPTRNFSSVRRTQRSVGIRSVDTKQKKGHSGGGW